MGSVSPAERMRKPRPGSWSALLCLAPSAAPAGSRHEERVVTLKKKVRISPSYFNMQNYAHDMQMSTSCLLPARVAGSAAAFGSDDIQQEAPLSCLD